MVRPEPFIPSAVVCPRRPSYLAAAENLRYDVLTFSGTDGQEQVTPDSNVA